MFALWAILNGFDDCMTSGLPILLRTGENTPIVSIHECTTKTGF